MLYRPMGSSSDFMILIVMYNIYGDIFHTMTGGKKGITYKTSYKALKNLIGDKLDKEHQFPTKKERKQAIKSAMAETRNTFKAGIAEYLDSSIDRSIRNLPPLKEGKANARYKRITKT
jgi:hypothetical protein